MVSKSPSNAALRSSFSFFFEVIETTLATCNKCGEPPPQPRCSARAAALTFQWSAPSSHTVSHVLSVATGKKTNHLKTSREHDARVDRLEHHVLGAAPAVAFPGDHCRR